MNSWLGWKDPGPLWKRWPFWKMVLTWAALIAYATYLVLALV